MSLGTLHYLASIADAIKWLSIVGLLAVGVVTFIVVIYSYNKEEINKKVMNCLFLSLTVLAILAIFVPSGRDFLKIANIDKIVETKIDKIVREKLNIKETEND